MTIKLNSLARWDSLSPENGIMFAGSDVAERRVRINFNCERPTAFFIQLSEREPERFLTALPAGLETVEFNAAGSFMVFAAEGSGAVHYQSADLEPTFVEVVDPVIFTRIANRRHRNPELEEMMYRAQLNMERRFAQLAAEQEAALERRRMEIENGRPVETIITNAPGAAANAAQGQVPAQGSAGEESGSDGGTTAGSQHQGDGGKPKP